MRFAAGCSTALDAALHGAEQPAEWLGVADRALYLQTRAGTVLALLTRDATRLPCALVLPTTAAQTPLSRLVGPLPRPAATVGGGAVRWAGPADAVEVAAVRAWAPPRLRPGRPQPAAVEELRRALGGRDAGLDPTLLAAFAGGPAAVPELLGRGPGLTPSGDDVLAGYLIGTIAFEVHDEQLREAVAALAGQRTTALSAQLLRHAAAGEAAPEVVAGAELLSGRPWPISVGPTAIERLLSVGHTSGAALAHGLLAAAERALSPVAIGGSA